MAIKRERDPEICALIQRATAELRASNPELFEEPKPYTDEEYAQILGRCG